jgi:hypothetical protein
MANNFKFFPKTKGEINENLERLNSRLGDNQRYLEKMATVTPENLRDVYDLIINNINLREEDDRQRLTEIEQIEPGLNQCKQLISEIKNVTDNIKQKFNAAKVGTLEALSRQYITQNNIKPRYGSVEQEVLNQRYDERRTPWDETETENKRSKTNKGGKHTKRHRNKSKKTKTKNRQKY